MSELINFRPVVAGKVFRGAAPYGWDADQVDEFADRHGVQAVVDLRTEPECRLAPWAGLPSGRVELINAACELGAGTVDLAALQGPEELGELYVQALSLHADALLSALEPIAEGKVTLFHCSAGKDRTGVISALVGLLARHSDEVIIEQYALTEQNMMAIAQAMAVSYGSLYGDSTAQLMQDNPAVIMTARPPAMSTFLAGLRAQHGTVEQYLASVGADQTLISRLTERLTEPSAAH